MNTYFVTRKQLKQEVKQLFSHKWGIAILMSLGGYIFGILNNVIQNYHQKQVQEQLQASGNINVIDLFGNGQYQVIFFVLTALTTFTAVAASYGYLDWLNSKQQPDQPAKISFQTFSKKYFTSTLAIFLFRLIFIFLWLLLFIIPGIIKAYSYSQAFLIYKTHVDNGDSDICFLDCITESRQLMDGHKWDFFVLQLSFLGWYILGAIPFGIGLIWVIPYISATTTNFYRHLLLDK